MRRGVGMANAAQRQKTKRAQESKALLEGVWGELFHYAKPKPLKIGIFEDLLVDAKAKGLQVSHAAIKRAVWLYVRRSRYTKALRQGGPRYDLSGAEAGVVSEEELRSANEQWEKLKTLTEKQSVAVETLGKTLQLNVKQASRVKSEGKEPEKSLKSPKVLTLKRTREKGDA